MKRILLIGLTGRSGSGKTAAAGYLCGKGLPVIVSDDVVREVEKKGEPCLAALAGAFGAGVLNEDGELNRHRLGEICFSDREKLQMLNSIVHPYVIERILEETETLAEQGERCCIVEAPQLVESGLIDRVDRVVLIRSSRNLERLLLRDGVSEEQLRARLNAQYTDEYLAEIADIVIDNDSTLEDLYSALDKLILIINEWVEGIEKNGGNEDEDR